CASDQFGECGVRGAPAVEAVADALRWVDGHRDEACRMGRAASDWALRHRNIWSKAPRVLDVMEEHSRPSRPLRRLRRLWVPSWGSACGVAEYTAHLVARLHHVHVQRELPDLPRTRLLHVQ